MTVSSILKPRLAFLICLLCSMSFLPGEEVSIAFSEDQLGETPSGFRSAVTGEGEPGRWQVVMDRVPSFSTSLTPPERPVIAQKSRDMTDEHFPLLIWENRTFGDFTLKTKLKAESGVMEQMAGVAFRIQDERNYYVIRISAKGDTLRFYKFVNGLRSQPVGPDLPISAETWHDLEIRCRGNSIRCKLNGKEVMPELTDYTFTEGKIGLWTKSDSVSYFADLYVDYTPIKTLAETLVEKTMDRYPRLKEVTLFAKSKSNEELRVVASTMETKLNQAASDVEKHVFADGVFYTDVRPKQDNTLVTLPLRDRNGEIMAAVRLGLDSFPGQTKNNALVRGRNVLDYMQLQVQGAISVTD